MAKKPTRPQTDQRWMLHWCGDRLEDVPEENDHWAKRWGVAPCCTIRTMCILSLWCGNYYGSSLLTQYITVRIVLNHLPPLKVKHGDHLTQEDMCHFIFTNSRTRGYWCEKWESPYFRQLRQNYTMSGQVSHSWLLANLIWQMQFWRWPGNHQILDWYTSYLTLGLVYLFIEDGSLHLWDQQLLASTDPAQMPNTLDHYGWPNIQAFHQATDWSHKLKSPMFKQTQYSIWLQHSHNTEVINMTACLGKFHMNIRPITWEGFVLLIWKISRSVLANQAVT